MASNILQNIATYQKSDLGLLQNSYVYLDKANKKFNNFQDRPGNRGDTVTFDLRTRYVANDGLVVGSFQDTEQRVQSLVVDKAKNVAYEFNDEERIFNVKDYMKLFGESAVCELGGEVESDVALNNVSHTYRAFGDGVTDINSYGQLAQACANYRNYGSAKSRICGIIPDVKVPAIINSGLQQFATKRNDKDALDWELGPFSQVEWYSSNLLPEHVAGTLGQAQTTLTVDSINGAGTQITLSNAGTDADAIKSGDILTFQDGVSGQPNMRFLTFNVHKPSAQKVQVRATADAASAADVVVVNIFPALVSTAGDRNQNINNPVAAGMEIKALPDHTAGLLFHEPSLMLAMPRLPLQTPFPTASVSDPDSGASMRVYYGTQFGQNLTGFVHDVIWGSTLVDEYAMRLVFTTA